MEEALRISTVCLDKGITTSPSELVCEDRCMSVCDGMVNLNGELSPLQKPLELFTREGYTLLFVHEFNTEKHYIFKASVRYAADDISDDIYYCKEKDGDIIKINTKNKLGEVYSIKSIGKTLIVASKKGMFYFLWSNGAYKDLGNSIPEPKVEFQSFHDRQGRSYDSGNIDVRNCIEYNSDTGCKITDTELYNNLVIGNYYELQNKIKKEGKFNSPYFVRYAIELFDGSYTKISNPILMMPFVRGGMHSQLLVESTPTASQLWLKMYMNYAGLRFKSANTDTYKDWQDIVRGVTIFISNPIDCFYTKDAIAELHNSTYFKQERIGVLNDEYDAGGNELYQEEHFGASTGWELIKVLEQKTDATIKDELKKSSVFYKILNIPITEDVSNWTDISSKADRYVLENLTTQSQLVVQGVTGEDYYSHTNLMPKKLATYNHRLNVFDTERSIFGGFNYFFGVQGYWENSTNKPIENNRYLYKFFVTIQTNDGERVVVNELSSKRIPDIFGVWFYYPDPRAKKVSVYCRKNGQITEDLVGEFNLEEHSGLNGAFYMGDFPTGDTYEQQIAEEGVELPDVNDDPETLPDQLIQSEVDNPFTFFANGYTTIGTGRILGVASLTTALSQGQYGQYPLICFTSEGIWALGVGDDGTYVTVHPFSREVCINPSSITPTDGEIFFASKKGLMLVGGTQIGGTGVVCVSQQIQGKGSKEFIETICDKGTKFAWDYKERLLYIIPGNNGKIWVYSIETKTFSTTSKLPEYIAVVPSYPDYIVQDGNYTLYSMYERPNRDEDENIYDAEIKSRALKLEGSLILKSLRQVKHLMQLFSNDESNVNVEFNIYVSNDSEDWYQINSLKGKAWKFYKIEYKFKNMLATSTFSGIELATQKRRTDRLR